MDPLAIAAELAAIGERRPGSDAERRAAVLLARRLRASGRSAGLETVWVRAAWQLPYALICALGVAACAAGTHHQVIGIALCGGALIALLLDLAGLELPARVLVWERATQNVVSPPPDDQLADADRVRLIIAASYDAPRTASAQRRALRLPGRRLQALAAGALPGPFGWLAICLLALAGVLAGRLAGAGGTAIGIAQLIPGVVLLGAILLLVDAALAPTGPGAGEPGSAAAVAVALAAALDSVPPRRLAVEVVLGGAGEGGAAGLRRHLWRRRHELTRAGTAVLGIAASGAGRPRWWIADGRLLPLAFHPTLCALAARVAAEEPRLGARPHRGRGLTPGLLARARRLPAITIGCLDADGLVPRAHTAGDTAEALDRDALEGALALCLGLVAALDDDLAARGADASATTARPRARSRFPALPRR